MSEQISELYDAAVYGDEETVLRLLNEQPELVRAGDEYGFTALHGVASEEHVSIAELLIKRGADVNAINDEDITPLHLAASPEMVSLLASHGANLDIRNVEGMTPLFVMASEGGQLASMQRLLELGADPTIPTYQGLTPLNIALARGEDQKVALLQTFLQKDSNS